MSSVTGDVLGASGAKRSAGVAPAPVLDQSTGWVGGAATALPMVQNSKLAKGPTLGACNRDSHLALDE
jgi:hypothetical protein